MKPIEVREQGKTRAHLSQDEVQQLLATKVVGLAPVPGEESYEIRAGSTVGTIVLPSLRLLIRPKVDLENLFFLLGFGAGLTNWTEAQFPYEGDPDLFRAVAWIFEAEVRRAAAQGMVRGYEPRSETLTTLRGRIDVAAQLRARQGRPFPLDCRFEEYTEDLPLNRVIKAAHRRLLQIPALDTRLAARLRHRYRTFDSVSSVEYSAPFLPQLRFTRLDRLWEPAGQLALLILRQQGIRDQAGKMIGTTFTVDMNELFERFVESMVRKEAQRAGLKLRAQAPRHLTETIPIRPDLVLVQADKDLAVGDAKYKQLEPGGWSNQDLYQLLAYCVSLGLPKGLLIYATEHPLEHHAVERAGVGLEIVGIDMSHRPQELEEAARAAARRLVQHAIELRSSRTKKAG